MNGPNYVKLSRVFAVRLLSVFIAHYTALPPVRGGPCWSHSYVITASFRLTPTQTHTATPTARDPNLGSGNHDMSKLPTFTYQNDVPTHHPRPCRHTPSLLLPADVRCGTPTPHSKEAHEVQSAWTWTSKSIQVIGLEVQVQFVVGLWVRT